MGRGLEDRLLCLADPLGDFAYLCSLYFRDLLNKLFENWDTCCQSKYLSVSLHLVPGMIGLLPFSL